MDKHQAVGMVLLTQQAFLGCAHSAMGRDILFS